MTEQQISPDPLQPDYCGKCTAKLEMQPKGGRLRPVCPQCGWVYYSRPAFGAAVLVEIDEKILLVRRGHEPYKGWWMLPAGFVEYDECATDTAVREAMEETGLEVLLTGLSDLYYGSDDPRNPSHLAVYGAEVVGGQLRAGDDAAEVGLFAPEEVPRTIAFGGQRRAITKWISSKLGETVDPADFGERE